jgi:hypothetical protein
VCERYYKQEPLLIAFCSFQCEKCAREVYVEGVTARKGGEVVGITKANGDKATLVNVCTDAKTPCQNYNGPGKKDGAC